MTRSRKELPLVRRRVEALLCKTVETGCNEEEASAAVAKAEALVAEYGIDRRAFRWPQNSAEASGAVASGPEAPKPPRKSGSSRGRGIGKLAERLIVEHPDWTYAAIAAEVNRQVDGAQASQKSVKWYASRMRKHGVEVPFRRRVGSSSSGCAS